METGSGFLNQDATPGVVFGLQVRDPQSATLTATVEGGWVNVKHATIAGKVTSYAIQPTTKAFTASKDTYVYIDGTTGVVTYNEQTLGATQPSQATIGANSLWLAKVVTDGTRVTDGGVTDLRGRPARQGDLSILTTGADVSFVTAAQGAYYIHVPFNCRVLYADSAVTSVLGATDTGTITLAIHKNGKPTNMTNGVITHAISAAFGTRNACTPSAANFVSAGNWITATTLKTTTGGTASVMLVVERLPA